MTGPVPKEHKLGHPMRAGDQDARAKHLAQRPSKPVKPPETNADWHPITRGWFNAIKLSPLVPDYRETDWMTAIVGAELLDAGLCNGWTTATLHEFGKISERLCLTIGDRRRARIEIVRAGLDEEEAGAAEDLANWQRKLAVVPDAD